MMGCGDDKNKSSSSNPSGGSGLTSGVFLDSAVEGLQYLSGGNAGLTDANGTFLVDGSTVQFFIGGIVLGEATAKAVMTPIDLVPGATNETDQRVTNITRFLLSLDDDADPSNGIQIRQEVRDAAVGKSINFDQSTDLFGNDPNVQLIVAELTALTTSGAGALISAIDAQTHLSSTLLGIRSFTFNVTTAGEGAGTVTSSPGGINCESDCSKIYADGTNVTLTATPSGNSTFVGWSGDADCTDGVVSMTANITCIATFELVPIILPSNPTLTIVKNGTGAGTVISSPAGIDCGVDCTGTFTNNTSVTLTASESTGSTFAGWSGGTDCTDGVVMITADMSCTATFELVPIILPDPILTIVKTGDGTGTVTSSPVGIDCGADCTGTFSDGTSVFLTYTESEGSVFTGWGGDADCVDGVITMTSNISCTGTFDLKPKPKWTLPKEKEGDDLRLTHLVLGDVSNVIAVGRVNDFEVVGGDILLGFGGPVLAEFNLQGEVVRSDGEVNSFSNTSLIPGSMHWDEILGIAYDETKDRLVVSMLHGNTDSNQTVPSTVVSISMATLWERVWKTDVVQHCGHSEMGDGIAIDVDTIYFSGPGCLMGITHDGVVLGQLKPNPNLSTGNATLGKIKAIVVEVDGFPHIGVGTYTKISDGTGNAGGIDAGLMAYKIDLSLDVTPNFTTEWGGIGDESVRGMCVKNGKIFVLSDGPTIEFRMYSPSLTSYGDPTSIDLSSAGHIKGQMTMFCDATYAYVASPNKIQKIKLSDLTSAFDVATTEANPMSMVAIGNTIVMANGTNALIPFSATDGSPIF